MQGWCSQPLTRGAILWNYPPGRRGGTGPPPHNMRRTTLCGAAPPYSLDVRFWGSGTTYSKAAHIPVRRAGATPLSLKVHPLCLQKVELGYTTT